MVQRAAAAVVVGDEGWEVQGLRLREHEEV